LRNALRGHHSNTRDDLAAMDPGLAETFRIYTSKTRQGADYRSADESDEFSLEIQLSPGDLRKVVFAKDAHGNPRPYNKDMEYVEYIEAFTRWVVFRTVEPNQPAYFTLPDYLAPVSVNNTIPSDAELRQRILGSTVNWDAILANFDETNLSSLMSHEDAILTMFRLAVDELSPEDQGKLMSFWTGVAHLPYPAIKRLRVEVTHYDPYGGAYNQLFTASTCSHLLRIPRFPFEQQQFTQTLRNVVNAPQTYENS
jgi:hypothetical protein